LPRPQATALKSELDSRVSELDIARKDSSKKEETLTQHIENLKIEKSARDKENEMIR